MNLVGNLFFAILVLVGTTTWAGTEVGNGGDAVVCRNSSGKILSAELLDYYEARVKYGFTLKPANTFDENIRLILGRLRSVNSHMVDEYELRVTQFRNEALFLSGSELVDIPDSEHIFFPKGCKVEQLAVQVVPRFEYEKRYTINQDIWDSLDEANKAGLVIHEVFYRDRLGRTSIYVRNLNGLLMADRLKDAQGNVFKLADLFQKFRGSSTVTTPEGTINFNSKHWLLTNAVNFKLGPTVLNGDQFRINVHQDDLTVERIVYIGKQKDGRTAIFIPRQNNFLSDIEIPNWVTIVTIPGVPLKEKTPLNPQVVFDRNGSIRALTGWHGHYPQPKMPGGTIVCQSIEIPIVLSKEGTLEICEMEKFSTPYEFEFSLFDTQPSFAKIRTSFDFSKFKSRALMSFAADGTLLWNPYYSREFYDFLWSMITGFPNDSVTYCQSYRLCPLWQLTTHRSDLAEGSILKLTIDNKEWTIPIVQFTDVAYIGQWAYYNGGPTIYLTTPQSLPIGPHLIEFTAIMLKNDRIVGGILAGPYTEVIDGRKVTYLSKVTCPSSIFNPPKYKELIYPIYFDEAGKVISGYTASSTKDCYRP